MSLKNMIGSKFNDITFITSGKSSVIVNELNVEQKFGQRGWVFNLSKVANGGTVA